MQGTTPQQRKNVQTKRVVIVLRGSEVSAYNKLRALLAAKEQTVAGFVRSAIYRELANEDFF